MTYYISEGQESALFNEHAIEVFTLDEAVETAKAMANCTDEIVKVESMSTKLTYDDYCEYWDVVKVYNGTLDWDEVM